MRFATEIRILFYLKNDFSEYQHFDVINSRVFEIENQIQTRSKRIIESKRIYWIRQTFLSRFNSIRGRGRKGLKSTVLRFFRQSKHNQRPGA